MGYRTGKERGLEQGIALPTTSGATPISPPPTPEPIVLEAAKELIDKCRADGTYRLSNGEVGLIMIGGIFQPVKGATEEGIRALQNPECPFTRSATE